MMRIALATLPFAGSICGAIANVRQALGEAADQGADIVCTPENYLPGLRCVGLPVDAVELKGLSEAFDVIATEVKRTKVALVLGTELPTPQGVLMTALVYNSDGTLLGRQDKVQLDPSEKANFIQGLAVRFLK